MAIITITTPFNIDLEFKIATFNKRLSAWVIDIVIICLYYYLIMVIIYPLLKMGEAISTSAGLFFIIIPVLVYQLVFELLFNGQTIGKKLAGIKVIDVEGREPTWGQYITRWILCLGNLSVYAIPHLLTRSFFILPAFLVLYAPDFLCMVITARAQRIGDLAAGTVVIDKNYRSDINETIYLDIDNVHYQAVFPEVMRLTDRDINGIRNLLSKKRTSRETEHYMIDISQKIKAVLQIESDLYPSDFLHQLLKDYNHLSAGSKGNGKA